MTTTANLMGLGMAPALATLLGNGLAPVQYTASTATSAATATAALMAGAPDVTLGMTGTLAAGANLTTDTAANIISAITALVPNAQAGFGYRLRIINSSSGNYAWTLVGGTGVTTAGTMTIAQNTWRDFYVTFTSLSAVKIQAIGTGTQS